MAIFSSCLVQPGQYCGVMMRRGASDLLAPPRCHSVPFASIRDPAGMTTFMASSRAPGSSSTSRTVLSPKLAFKGGAVDKVFRPQMTAGNDFRGAVSLGCIVKRPEGADGRAMAAALASCSGCHRNATAAPSHRGEDLWRDTQTTGNLRQDQLQQKAARLGE